jgi:hypothetical protein
MKNGRRSSPKRNTMSGKEKMSLLIRLFAFLMYFIDRLFDPNGTRFVVDLVVKKERKLLSLGSIGK